MPETESNVAVTTLLIISITSRRSSNLVGSTFHVGGEGEACGYASSGMGHCSGIGVTL